MIFGMATARTNRKKRRYFRILLPSKRNFLQRDSKVDALCGTGIVADHALLRTPKLLKILHIHCCWSGRDSHWETHRSYICFYSCTPRGWDWWGPPKMVAGCLLVGCVLSTGGVSKSRWEVGGGSRRLWGVFGHFTQGTIRAIFWFSKKRHV